MSNRGRNLLPLWYKTAIVGLMVDSTPVNHILEQKFVYLIKTKKALSLVVKTNKPSFFLSKNQLLTRDLFSCLLSRENRDTFTTRSTSAYFILNSYFLWWVYITMSHSVYFSIFVNKFKFSFYICTFDVILQIHYI